MICGSWLGSIIVAIGNSYNIYILTMGQWPRDTSGSLVSVITKLFKEIRLDFPKCFLQIPVFLFTSIVPDMAPEFNSNTGHKIYEENKRQKQRKGGGITKSYNIIIKERKS